MNPQRLERWAQWRQQDQLKTLAEYGRLLAQQRQQMDLCAALQACLDDYDRLGLDGQVLEVHALRVQRGFSGQVAQVCQQQQGLNQVMAQHLDQLLRRIEQRQAQIEQVRQKIQTTVARQQQAQELKSQAEIQAWAALSPPYTVGH